MNLRAALALTLVACPTLVAHAVPTIEALYLQNEFLPGADQLPGFNPGDGRFDPGDVVRSNGQRDVLVTPNGSFVTPVNTGDIFNNGVAAGEYYLFGTTNPLGETPLAIRRESTIGGQEQIVFGSQAGIDYSGAISYSASIPNPTPGGSARLSSLWEDDTLVYVSGDAAPAGPLSGSFISGPGGLYRSPSGDTSWVSSYSAVAGGPNSGSALIRGTSTYDVLLQSGDNVPGIGTIGVSPEGSTISSNIVWSQLGTNYLTTVGVPDGGTDLQGNPTFGEGVVVNGTALTTTSGTVLMEGLSIPTADGGLAGETFGSFQGWDVNEAGDWAVGAFTDGVSSGQDDVLIHNGQVVYRAGEVVDGIPLTGQIQGVGLNDRGDLAFAWNDTLFINGQAIAGSNTIEDAAGNDIPGLATPIDRDGDGTVDSEIGGTGLSLNKFEISNILADGGDGLPVVYFAGEVFWEETVNMTTLQFRADTTFRLAPSISLAGDYNRDGVVDVADYTTWRDTLGSEALLGADGDGDNIVDNDDYTVWVNAMLGGASTSVPEPTALACLVIAAIGLTPTRR